MGAGLRRWREPGVGRSETISGGWHDQVTLAASVRRSFTRVTPALYFDRVPQIRLTGYGEVELTTVGSLTGNLAELLFAMRHDGRALIALFDFSDDRYVQFWLQPGGRIVGEVVSNLNIGTSPPLSPWAEDRLLEIGFHEATPGPKPNWWFESGDVTGLRRFLTMMNTAIYDVLQERSSNSVPYEPGWPKCNRAIFSTTPVQSSGSTCEFFVTSRSRSRPEGTGWPRRRGD